MNIDNTKEITAGAVFELLTKSEVKTLKELLTAKGMHERVFYNLKKKPLTIGFMKTAYTLFGLLYDFKTDTISREQRTRAMTIEEVDAKIDEYLNAPYHS